MSELTDLQHIHSMRLAMLILFADQKGYKVSGGDWFRDERCDYGHPKSLHRDRLATDLALRKDNILLKETEDYRELGKFWESLGGYWGGHFGDGNHFSTPYRGMR